MNSLRHRQSVVLVLAGMLWTNTLGAAQMSFSPSRDTTLHADDPNASNGAGPVFFAGRTNRGAGSLRRALIYFDLSSIPAGSTVTAASLTLSVTREPGTPPQNGTVRRVFAQWGEAGSTNSNGNGAPAQPGDATWTYRLFGSGGQLWASVGGDLAPAASASAAFGAAGTTTTFASTLQLVADVQSWVDQPSANCGWAILGDETVVGSATQFASRENSNAALRPRLEVTYDSSDASVPLFTPMTALLTAAALLVTGIFHLRRRRAAQ